MSKTHNYIDVSRKSLVCVVKPSRRSQERARVKARNDFSAFKKKQSSKEGVLIIFDSKR